MGRAFQASLDMLHIFTKSVLVEAAYWMSIVECYHRPLRRAFNSIVTAAPDLDIDDVLQMAVKTIKGSVGPDGLVLTLLVFGALPRLRLCTDHPHPSRFHRAIALSKETELMSR